MLMDYAVLPPEVNSGRMYAGAGSAPMMAAAEAWDRLAATLSSAAASYHAVISELIDGSWRGPASMSMAAAADPYVQWMNTTAAQAEQTASQARAAAAAYEAAFAATVPPPVIAANRATLAVLVATNFFGQNTPAIAANQAEYAEMWAQDAVAMYGYAASSTTAMTLTPLTPAPQTANPAAASTQATATAQSAATAPAQSLTDILGNLPDIFAPLNQFLDNATTTGLNNFLGPVGTLLLQSSGAMFLSEAVQLFELPLMTATGKLAMLTPIAAAEAATGAGLMSSTSAELPTATLAGSHGWGVSGSLGSATPIGRLSVPPSWGASPEVRLAATTLPTAGPPALPQAGLGAPSGWVGGPIGSMVNAPRNGETPARPGAGRKGITASAGEANGDHATQSRWAQGASAPAGGLSDRERDELDQLREEMGDLAGECDAMARLMREAMR